MKHLKKRRPQGAELARRELQLQIAERQADVNRDVLEALRKLQQELRATVNRQHAIERAQEQLALAFIRCSTALGGALPGSEVAGA